MSPKFLFRLAILIYLLLSTRYAQLISQNNSLTLSFEEYMNQVRTNHPVARQADLLLQSAEFEIMNGRGNFDPEVLADVKQKYFDGSKYYDKINGGFKIPTWFGIEIKMGYEHNVGDYINPENNTPQAGLWYAGISVPLGRNLIIDERRAQLKKAEVYAKMTQSERDAVLNDLYYKAGIVYWNWYRDYHKLSVARQALQLAEDRKAAVLEEAISGNIPLIDTVEANIQVQNRQLYVQYAEMDLANSKASMEIYLWDEGLIPIELTESTIPPGREEVSIDPVNQIYLNTADSLSAQHPELQKTQFLLEQYEIDKKLKEEQLKPELNLQYNPISEPVNGNPFAEYSLSNYTWGLQFSTPLFLRKGRSDVQLAKLQIESTEIDIENKRAAIILNTKTALNKWTMSVEQYATFTKNVRDYRSLLEGEVELFDTGESSLFLVNSRETGYIQTIIKSIEILCENKKAGLSTKYALGLLS